MLGLMMISSLDIKIFRSGASVAVIKSMEAFCALSPRLTASVCAPALESALFALIAASSLSSTVRTPASISLRLMPSSPKKEPKKESIMPRTSTPFRAAWKKPRPLRFMYAVFTLPRKYTPINSSPVKPIES